MKKVVVVGGGPAGLMAAAVAAEQGAQVILLEKMAWVGIKLSITGNGRCNLTANVENSDLIKGIPGNGRFLYSAFQQFSNTDLQEFLHSRGLPTKVEGKRVFPLSDKAKDVVELLSKNARQAGVEIILSHKVSAIGIRDLEVKHALPIQVKSDRGCFSAAAVIIATGGMSYPGTGSSGDGYAWAEKLGHHIVTPRPALVPLVVKESWIRKLQGLSLGEVRAGAYTDTGKLINEDFGELLFTHYGLSGPLILSLSHAVGAYLFQQQRPAIISLDLKPSLQAEALDAQLLDLLSRNGRKILKNALEDLLPPKLIPVIISLSGLQAEKECHQVTRAQRLELVRLLKHFSMTVRATRPLAEAIVTAGGVDVKEVNPKTMESRLVKGIYFAGEILDVDGYTGGYNLQAAFSSGYVAGKNAAII